MSIRDCICPETIMTITKGTATNGEKSWRTYTSRGRLGSKRPVTLRWIIRYWAMASEKSALTIELTAATPIPRCLVAT